MGSTTQTSQFDLPLPYPAGSATPNVPVDLQALANAVAAALAALPKFATDTELITPTAAGAATSITVNFPAGLFDAAPNVFATIVSASNVDMQCEAQGATADSFTLTLVSANTTPRSINWLAIQL